VICRCAYGFWFHTLNLIIYLFFLSCLSGFVVSFPICKTVFDDDVSTFDATCTFANGTFTTANEVKIRFNFLLLCGTTCIDIIFLFQFVMVKTAGTICASSHHSSQNPGTQKSINMSTQLK